jgi:hypothetical protein
MLVQLTASDSLCVLYLQFMFRTRIAQLVQLLDGRLNDSPTGDYFTVHHCVRSGQGALSTYSQLLQSYLSWTVKCPKCETNVFERNRRLGCGEWCGRDWRHRPRGDEKGSKIDMQM